MPRNQHNGRFLAISGNGRANFGAWWNPVSFRLRLQYRILRSRLSRRQDILLAVLRWLYSKFYGSWTADFFIRDAFYFGWNYSAKKRRLGQHVFILWNFSPKDGNTKRSHKLKRQINSSQLVILNIINETKSTFAEILFWRQFVSDVFFLLNFDQSIFNRALATFKTGLAQNIDRSPDSFLTDRQKLCINLFEEDRFSIWLS